MSKELRSLGDYGYVHDKLQEWEDIKEQRYLEEEKARLRKEAGYRDLKNVQLTNW